MRSLCWKHNGTHTWVVLFDSALNLFPTWFESVYCGIISLCSIAMSLSALCYQIQEHFLLTYLYPVPKLLCINLCALHLSQVILSLLLFIVVYFLITLALYIFWNMSIHALLLLCTIFPLGFFIPFFLNIFLLFKQKTCTQCFLCARNIPLSFAWACAKPAP